MIHRLVPHLTLVSSCALVLLGVGCSDRELELPSDPPSDEARTSLDAVHEAYLQGDWTRLGQRVRDVVLDAHASDLVRENALEVLDKAYEVNGGALPSDWTLDHGVEKLIVGMIHGIGPDGPNNHVYIQGNMRDASHVAEVTLRLLPDDLVLERSSGKGTYRIKHDTPGYDDFNLDRTVTTLPPDGVFSLHIGFDDDTAIDGWVIGRSLASSAVPEMRSPIGSASFTDKHPLVSWTPFQSPEYRPFESRFVSLWENGKEQSGREQSWGWWTNEPDNIGEVHIGDPTGSRFGGTSTDLAPGDYWVMVDASEARSFGPVSLMRSSRAIEPFHVVR